MQEKDTKKKKKKHVNFRPNIGPSCDFGSVKNIIPTCLNTKQQKMHLNKY